MISLIFTACGQKSPKPEEASEPQDKVEEVEEVDEPEEVEESTELDYENMTAEDLIKDIEDIKNITVDEYLTLLESYKYVEMGDYFGRDDNITYDAIALLEDQEAVFPDSSEVLEKGLQSPVAVVRAEALSYLITAHAINDENIEMALKTLEAEEDPYVLYTLTDLVENRMETPEVADFIFKMSHHENTAIRNEAAGAIGNLKSRGVEGTVERIIELMEDENDDVRKTAYKNAGYLADDRVVEPIAKALMDPDQVDFHGPCMDSLTKLWLDFPNHENTSEKAYRATIDYLKYTPRSKDVPSFSAISQVHSSKSEGEKFDAWKQKATYYKPNEIVEPMFEILKDPEIGWIAGTTAVKVVKKYGTQEQFNSLRSIIEGSGNPDQNHILEVYDEEAEE